MSKYIDLTGQVFGRLTAIRKVGRTKHKHTLWLCKCSCGNETITTTQSLRKGATKSCGCLGLEKSKEVMQEYNSRTVKKYDLTGRTFGRLKVIKRLENINRKRVWLCKCECGNDKIVSTSALLSGTTKSCGCLKHERDVEWGQQKGAIVRQDLTGTKFNKLTVLELHSVDSKYKVRWICKCDCGNTAVVTTQGLKSGHTKSCGCIKGRWKVKNLTGQRFGRLLVKHEVPKEERHRSEKVSWVCECDCGNTCAVDADSLGSGRTVSCGCLHDELSSKRMIVWAKEHKRERHWNWKGGISSLYDEVRRFLKSINWARDVYRKDNYTCQRCGDSTGHNLNAHHMVLIKNLIIYYNIKTVEEAMNCPAFRSILNGITLCKKCHKWVHSNANVNKEFIREIKEGEILDFEGEVPIWALTNNT
jgi:hypothetical protein